MTEYKVDVYFFLTNGKTEKVEGEEISETDFQDLQIFLMTQSEGPTRRNFTSQVYISKKKDEKSAQR